MGTPAVVTNAEIRDRFAHHPPLSQQRIADHQEIRDASAALAVEYNMILPESREKSLALTALQEAAMWANAAVAIHGDGR